MNNSKQASFNNLMSLAQASHQKGDLEMAVNLYRESLKVIKDQPDALQMMGIALSGMGKEEKAIECMIKAVNSSPDNPVFLVNLGELYIKSKKYEDAYKVLNKAIILKPDFAEAYHKLANTVRGLGKTEEAFAFYHKALELNPKHSLALHNLGNAMLETGNYTSAIRYYQQSISINANYPYAHNNLGIALQEWERNEEAIAHYKNAIRLKPDMKEAVKNLATLFDKMGKDQEAKELYKHLLKLSPGNKALGFHMDISSFVIPESSKKIDEYRHGLDAILSAYTPADFDDPASLIEYNAIPPSELIYQGRDDKEVKEKCASLFKNIKRTEINHRHTKPHIGFVVTSGHEGVFIKCMRGILNFLNSEIFDISVVCSLPNGEKILSAAIENPGVKYLSIPKDFNLALNKVSKAEFDILYYWEIGTDPVNYFLALCKPAKVQCTSWGWPTTSGMKEVDYFISSRHLEIEDGEKYYTEKLLKFERLPVYYYRPPVPETLKNLSYYNLSVGVPIYLCTQNLRKVHPDFDQAVFKILERDTKGVMVFIEDKQEYITSLVKKRMTLSAPLYNQRIVFIKRMEEAEYLGLLAQASVVLDTFYYGGGANTTYDAFEAGVPVVTMPTDMHKGRYAYAAYKQIAIEDCIANNIEQYIQLAVSIANDPQRRKDIIDRVKKKSGEIFEDKKAVKELSDFFYFCFQSK
ncbi:MAG: tetratricopeptide repeat protein [Cytophagaceae bacterium]|nr:tetratricopeptide repeat protein [Cytophagaceae bacterium]